MRVFERHGAGAARAAMAGNSVKSDILPVLALGGRAVHIEYELTWEMELADADTSHEGYAELDSIRDLPDLLATM